MRVSAFRLIHRCLTYSSNITTLTGGGSEGEHEREPKGGGTSPTGSLQVIHSMFTALFRRKPAVSVPDALVQRLESLEKLSRKLEEDRDLLREEFRRLRGTVTGGRRLRSVSTGPVSVDEIPHGDKDSLRAFAGLRAGAAFKHKE